MTRADEVYAMAVAAQNKPTAFAGTSTPAQDAARVQREIASVRAALTEPGTLASRLYDRIVKQHPEDAQAVADGLAGIGGAS